MRFVQIHCELLPMPLTIMRSISQALARRLVEDIRPFAGNVGDVPLETQILSVLNFYASGSYQK